MVTSTASSWPVRGTSFGLWLLAAGSVAFWALKLAATPAGEAPPPASARSALLMDPNAVARFLGGGPAPVSASAAPAPTLASRLALVGVVAGAQSRTGAALISVDGKPARPYRVGSQVEEGLVLQSVQGRQAVLAPQGAGAAPLTLEMPPLRK